MMYNIDGDDGVDDDCRGTFGKFFVEHTGISSKDKLQH